MKVLSLFSGIGAFEKALKNMKIPYELVGFSEIDKYAVKSYCAIHGVDESMNLCDITKIDETALPKDIDLITYGFPCQDISVAGKGNGFVDEQGNLTRSGLFFDALRVIEETKPRIAIAENVKNLTGKKFKNEFDIVLNSLEQAGYNNYWQVLNAKGYGIPQNRERVFIVSIRKDVDNGRFQFPEQIKTRNLFDLLETIVDEEYFLSDTAKETIKNTKFKIDNYKENTLKLIRGSYDGKVIMDYRYDEGLRIRQNNLCPTLSTKGSSSLSGAPIVYIDGNLRFITPKECFRLMGFDDEDFRKAEAVNSNTQLYKQAGNSIVVDVLEAIYTSLQRAGVM